MSDRPLKERIAQIRAKLPWFKPEHAAQATCGGCAVCGFWAWLDGRCMCCGSLYELTLKQGEARDVG